MNEMKMNNYLFFDSIFRKILKYQPFHASLNLIYYIIFKIYILFYQRRKL